MSTRAAAGRLAIDALGATGAVGAVRAAGKIAADRGLDPAQIEAFENK